MGSPRSWQGLNIAVLNTGSKKKKDKQGADCLQYWVQLARATIHRTKTNYM